MSFELHLLVGPGALVFFKDHGQDLIKVEIVALLSPLVGKSLDQLSDLEIPFLHVTSWTPNQCHDFGSNFIVVFDLDVGVALLGLSEVFTVLTELAVGVKEELLAEDVVVWREVVL